VAFFEAASWGVVIVINKRVLDYVNPLPLNVMVRFVATVSLLLLTVPLTALHAWSLTFRLSGPAAGYIAISAVVTWLISFNAYYYALRRGAVTLVTPLTSTDPLFTALFAAVLLGTALGGLTIAGLAVASVGVVLLSRWMQGGAEPHGEVVAAAAVGNEDGGAPVVALSLLTAAGWGLGPVLIELAERSNQGASAPMIVESQLLGLGLLLAIARWRHSAVLVHALGPGERRRVVLLVVAGGVIEAVWAVLYYLVIAHIGALLAVLIISTTPVFGILGGIVVLKERLSARLALAAAVTLLGVFLVTLQRFL
jgi:drug/metabolite transporter (DMT)-like permease